MEEILKQFVYSNGSTTEGSSENSNTTLTLDFDPVKTSNGGVYICAASLEVQAVNYTENVSEQFNLTVASRSNYIGDH